MGQRKWPATPLPERGKGKCRDRDRAGAEECPGTIPAYRLMGRGVGNSPLGGCRGDGEDERGVTAIRQVAGANLAYLIYESIDIIKIFLTYHLFHAMREI